MYGLIPDLMKTFLLILSTASLSLSVFAREWINPCGNKKNLEADLVEVKDASGTQVVVLKLRNGTTLQVPLAKLTPADQTYVREAKPRARTDTTTAILPVLPPLAAPAAGAETTEKPGAAGFKDMLKGKLVALDGKRVGKYEMEQEPKYYAFYFSAHWCPPCRAFTPKLVEFYNAQEGKKKDFEVIFVSQDHDEKSMEEYIKGDKMPFPAIAFRSTERMKEINKYAGSGIPCLVLVDKDGKVISDSYDGKTYTGPNKVMQDIATKTKQ